jgi:enoyl-[acyl-carrier protein] reductase I
MLPLHGKRVVVLGVASEESIAWTMAQVLAGCGAQVFVGFQQKFRSRVVQLLQANPGVVQGAFRCDVTDDAELQSFFSQVQGPIHGLVHAVAYTPPETFMKPIYEVTPEEFTQAMLVSSHSLLRVTRVALPLMTAGTSVMTLSYLGGQRVVPQYRMMGIAKAALEGTVRELAAEIGQYGIRVNAISAGPVRTLSAQALPMFQEILDKYPSIAPLRTNIDSQDVAGLSVFLCSDFSRHITGQVMFVDAGYSALGAYLS